MGDLCKEILVKRVMTTTEKILRAVLIAVTVLCIAAGLMRWPFLLTGIALAVVCCFLVPGFDLEYEYLYVNGELDIDKIMSKQKRKRVFSGDISALELMAPSQSHELDHYRSRSDIKAKDFSSGKQDAKTFTMILKKEQGIEMVTFEPSDIILKDMKRMAPREVHLQ